MKKATTKDIKVRIDQANKKFADLDMVETETMNAIPR